MNDRERNVALLIGRRVYAPDGRAIGRIEELHAEKEGDHYVVSAIDLGREALLERLAVRHLGISWGGRSHGYRARWDQIDLEDERRPTLTCPLEDLEELGPRTSGQRKR